MEQDTQPADRNHSALLNTLVIVSVVALGVVVAGLTTPADEPELTVAPTTSETPVPEPQQEYVYVTPEVDPSASIPGCDTVEPPTDTSYSSLFATNEEFYDNPAAPWYSGPKAHVMSEALMTALPESITAKTSLYFEPIPAAEDSQGVTFDFASAAAQLSRGDNPEYLSVGVEPRESAEIPACVAGQLDERRTLPDGTVVDTDDTWSETNGTRTYTRTATAYHSDLSTVSAYLAGGADENAFTLSLDDLVRVAADPNLRTSAPVPPGTPGNVTDCSAGWDDSSVERFSPDETRQLNDALRRADASALAPTPPLGALHTSNFGSGVCQTVNTSAGRLTISITRATPDTDATPTEEPQLGSPDAYGPGASATVRTPSGLDVTVSTTEPVSDRALLENLANTAGLDLR